MKKTAKENRIKIDPAILPGPINAKSKQRMLSDEKQKIKKSNAPRRNAKRTGTLKLLRSKPTKKMSPAAKTIAPKNTSPPRISRTCGTGSTDSKTGQRL
ncbi:hypothetical protein [Corynebacterium hiratae]|uniref:hypothetical protein n=1 Tax=Corynebacterium hiratae TaxID=3139423 RepID=UPI00272E5FCB|nr:hypothetical protein [Corynebacterium aurimucosum]